MAVGWALAGSLTRTVAPGRTARYCQLDAFTSQLQAAGGGWNAVEVLGDQWICKVRGPAALLTTIANTAGVTRLPVDHLDDSLASLSAGQKSAIQSKLQAMGYSLAELQARFPNDLGTYTLRDVVRFAASRCVNARWNGTTFVFDGASYTPPLPDVLETLVAD